MQTAGGNETSANGRKISVDVDDDDHDDGASVAQAFFPYFFTITAFCFFLLAFVCKQIDANALNYSHCELATAFRERSSKRSRFAVSNPSRLYNRIDC